MEKSQIDLLAEFIMAEVPGEPSKSEGAGECAIRIIRQLIAERDAARADEADTLATKDAYHMVLSAANTQIGTLTARLDAARAACIAFRSWIAAYPAFDPYISPSINPAGSLANVARLVVAALKE